MAEAAGSERNGGQIDVLRAEHAGDAFDEDIAVAREAIAEGEGLSYIAHFTNGILDFAIARTATLADDSYPGDGRYSRRAFERAGRHFNFMVTNLDNSCRPLESGPLIRVVAHGDTGAVYHYLKFPGQSFFGITLDGSQRTVARADRQMASIAEAATSRLGVQSLDWGGFRSRPSRPEKSDHKGNNTPEMTHAPRMQPQGSDFSTNAQALLCVKALNPAHLHYAAILRTGRLAVGADIFDDPALAPFFQKTTPELRRVGYMELLRQVESQTERLHQILETIGSHKLIRVVLDVAQGAIYFMPLNEDGVLVGVTLNQSQVDRAESELRALYAEIWKSGF